MAYETADEVVAFLYELMRDHVPCGVVERIVQVQEDCRLRRGERGMVYELSNEHLARYAQELRVRMSFGAK